MKARPVHADDLAPATGRLIRLEYCLNVISGLGMAVMCLYVAATNEMPWVGLVALSLVDIVFLVVVARLKRQNLIAFPFVWWSSLLAGLAGGWLMVTTSELALQILGALVVISNLGPMVTYLVGLHRRRRTP